MSPRSGALQVRLRAHAAPIAVFLLLGAWVAAVHDDYGMSWDEPFQARYGAMVRDYFASGFSDASAGGFEDLAQYGPHFELLATLLVGPAQTSGDFDRRHLLVGLTALLAAIMVWRAAVGMRSSAALAAPILLAGMPAFAGHAFVNSKDIPFCAAMTAGMALLIRKAGTPRTSRGMVALVGIAGGIAAGIRPGGLPIYLGLWLLAAVPPLMTAPRRMRRGLLRDLAAKSAAILAIAWLIMVLPWPHAHAQPLWGPLRAMFRSGSFTASFPVLFEGSIHKSSELPRRYLLQSLLISLPPSVIAMGAVGLALLVLRGARRGPRAARARAILVVAWLAGPPALQWLLRSNVYDGVRHVLFILPALALCAAGGVAGMASRFPARFRRWAAAGLCALAVAPALPAVWRLHPYEMTYHNAFVGGTRGAAGKYELDYWVTSYREAAEWVNEIAEGMPEGRVLNVMVAANAANFPCFSTYAGPRVAAFAPPDYPKDPRLPDSLDLYVATTRYGLAGVFPEAPIVHVIGRDGAPFTIVRASDRFLAEFNARGSTPGGP